MENQPAKSVIVTTAYTCMKTEGHALLSVAAGVPIELALEQAGNLLDCIDCLVRHRDHLPAAVHTTSLQYLDLSRALVGASCDELCAYQRTLH